MLKSNLEVKKKKKRINYQLNANISICCEFAKNKCKNIDQNMPVLQSNRLYFGFIFMNPENIQLKIIKRKKPWTCWLIFYPSNNWFIISTLLILFCKFIFMLLNQKNKKIICRLKMNYQQIWNISVCWKQNSNTKCVQFEIC